MRQHHLVGQVPPGPDREKIRLKSDRRLYIVMRLHIVACSDPISSVNKVDKSTPDNDNYSDANNDLQIRSDQFGPCLSYIDKYLKIKRKD